MNQGQMQLLILLTDFLQLDSIHFLWKSDFFGLQIVISLFQQISANNLILEIISVSNLPCHCSSASEGARLRFRYMSSLHRNYSLQL